jgi:hypothetical protein
VSLPGQAVPQLQEVWRCRVRIFPGPLQPAGHGASGTTQGTVDGDPEVNLGLLGDHLGQAIQLHLNHAALVLAAIPAIEVNQSYRHVADAIPAVGEEIAHPLHHVLQQPTGQPVAASLNVDLHGQVSSVDVPKPV